MKTKTALVIGGAIVGASGLAAFAIRTGHPRVRGNPLWTDRAIATVRNLADCVPASWLPVETRKESYTLYVDPRYRYLQGRREVGYVRKLIEGIFAVRGTAFSAYVPESGIPLEQAKADVAFYMGQLETLPQDAEVQITYGEPGTRKPIHIRRGRMTHVEYGCGTYGCVMPTSEPGLVCKVTSDPTEAAFVTAALSMPHFPDGIVHYKRIYSLPGVTFRRRPAWILWREEAFEVGNLPYQGERRTADVVQFTERLQDFRDVAGVVRRSYQSAMQPELARWRDWAWEHAAEWHTDWEDKKGERRRSRWTANAPMSITRYVKPYRGVQRVALALAFCEILAEWMESEPEGYLVGRALGDYLDAGILLADVHRNNIGRVRRQEYRTAFIVGHGEELSPWVITDPGHAVFLTDKFPREPAACFVEPGTLAISEAARSQGR